MDEKEILIQVSQWFLCIRLNAEIRKCLSVGVSGLSKTSI